MKFKRALKNCSNSCSAKNTRSYDRLKTYIAELKELDLIEDEASLKLTEKGKLFLREYKTVLDSMKRMGLTYR